MSAKQTSSTPAVKPKAVQNAKRLLPAGMAMVGGFLKTISAKAIPWCGDHVLSMAILLGFPLAIGAFYWNRDTPADTPSPGYLNQDSDPIAGKIAEDLPPVAEAPLTAVVPDVPINAVAPQILPAPHPPAELEFEFSRSMPIAVDSPQFVSGTNPEPYRDLGSGVSMADAPSSSETNCVWLTGRIETAEGPADSLRSASRVHELTMPATH